MIKDQIAIVGGGLAGLTAARLLHKAGVDFILLEARDQFGGRILTVDGSGKASEDGFDRGPSWYWPQMQPTSAALVEELGLAAFAQNSEGDVVFERMSRESAQRYQAVGMDRQSMRLAGGTATLVRALIHELPADKLVLGAEVTAMALTGDGVELTIAHAAGEKEKLVASKVIAALPPRLLEATVAFTPSQEIETARRWRETGTWMAPHAKFFAVYDRPFWREAGLSGTAQSMVGPMVEIHDATTVSGQAALFGFLGVGAGQRALVGEDALTQASLAQFARIFGPEASEPRSTMLKDWAAEALTATSADREAGGHPAPGEVRWVAGPWSERLILAGSESSPSEPGYLAGAVSAAEQAASAILAERTSDGHHA